MENSELETLKTKYDALKAENEELTKIIAQTSYDPESTYRRLENLRKENEMMREALEHPWLLETLECECGYYGEDTEETGMSECAKCVIERTLAKLSKKD